MHIRRIAGNRTLVGLLAVVTLLVASVGVGASPAEAQEGQYELAATCGDLAVLSIPEGPLAIEAAESLRERGAPNPPGIEDALDVIVAAAESSSAGPGVVPALTTLDNYFGGACGGLDRCVFVADIAGSDDASSTEAARLLGRIETPAPPGIGAALALIAGEISESPFHANVAEAKAQILDYYPCEIDTGGDGGEDGGLAYTGASTAPLAVLGVALLAAGGGTLHLRRRLLLDARR